MHILTKMLSLKDILRTGECPSLKVLNLIEDSYNFPFKNSFLQVEHIFRTVSTEGNLAQY